MNTDSVMLLKECDAVMKMVEEKMSREIAAYIKEREAEAKLEVDEKSKEITIRIFENVINMVKREDCSFDEIVCRITTKGGTTEAGMKNLNQELITENLEICMKKSYEKANNIM